MESGSSGHRGAAAVVEEGEEQQQKHRKLLQSSDGSAADPPPDPATYARSYQLEAFEKAKMENTIVFLETGAGKTLIAIMLLRSYAYMLRKPSRHIAVFLVPTVVLVHQQANVVEMHTDLKVGRFWGEMGVDLWNAGTWKAKLDEFEVFVMTPQILLDNLRHTFFKLSDIKLLIFDECHHARGRHPYACIMMEFYHRQLSFSSDELPRIFGMTASLVNSKGSNSQIFYRKQILELESLMNCKVYTVASESVLSPYISFPTARIKLYEHVGIPCQLFSCLVDHLKSLKAKHLDALDDTDDFSTKESVQKKISKMHATFVFCLKELGAWLAVKAAELLSCKQNYLFFWGQSKDGIGEHAVKLFIQEVFQVFSSYLPKEKYIGDDLKADVDAGLLTSKVQCLIQSLLEYRDLHHLRCIIFVERVITAIVIQSLLINIKRLSGWGTQYMAGNNCSLHSQSRTEQMNIVDAFHEGKVNVIVATQILEEGLDVRGCNLVVRFDPSVSLCSFIQSRGRARMRGSDYLLIIRSGDSDTLSKVANFLNGGDMMREESIKQASVPCKSLQTNIFQDETYCVKATGAIVTLNSSVCLIYFYCSRLPSDEYFKPYPRFVYEKESRCILYLPKSSPIQVVCAEGKSDILRQVVCLEACKMLHEVGALTDFLLPAFDVEIEEDTEQSVVEPYKDEQADYFPGELVDSWSSFSCRGLYHCYKITIDQHVSYNSTFNDIILVVKSDLGSDFLSYSFILEAERGPVSVHLKYVGIVHLSHEQVMMAKLFQISIFHLLLHCDYVKLMETLCWLEKKHTSTAIAYLLVPAVDGKVDWHSVKSSSFSMSKAKDIGHSCAFKEVLHLLPTMNGSVCSCMLQNCIVYTPHNGKLYCVNGILSDLNANSTIKFKDGKVLSYKEYYQSRHGISLTYENEPLLAGRHFFKVRNNLHRRSFQKEKAQSDAGVELPPELCMIIMSPITANTVYSFSFAPSVMHRIQCLLLAARLKENNLSNMQNVAVPAFKVLEAITTNKCQEDFSLESLETVGDSFLKYAASQYLFRTYKHHHEGILSTKKDKLISNVALCRLGCHHNLAGFIRTKQFNPKEWFIPGDCVDHFVENSLFTRSKHTFISGTRHMKSKVIADSIEALIGVYLCSAGEKAAFKFMEWLGIELELHQEVIAERKMVSNPEIYINVKDLQLLLNYSFKNTSLLLEALTHGSYQIPDIPGCYQRLEFLGDAVLDFLMTWYLFNKYPGLTPGLLTDLRSASVNNDCYARAAIKARLNKHILHASSELHKKMTFYLGSDACTALPKVLGDIIESIAGAIYVDSGYNKEIVWESIKPLLEPLVSPETVERHPVRELEELCSRKSYVKTYSMSSQGRVASMTAQVKAAGAVYSATCTGPNKKIAKKMAAKAVLGELKLSGL